MHRLLILLPILVSAGCGSFADPTEWFSGPDVLQPTPLVELPDALAPVALWSQRVGRGTAEQWLNLQPAVLGDSIFVADGKGMVAALNPANGRQIWQVELRLPIAGGPGAGDGLVLLGTSDAQVVALAADSGAERWRARVSSEVLSVPAIQNGVVVVHTVDGKVFGLEATNGNERWRYEREVPALTLRGVGSPVISRGAVFVGMAGGKLVSLRLDNGSLLWEVSVTAPTGRSELQRLADIDGDPIVFGGGVFVATYQGEVVAVEQREARVVWRAKMSAHSRMAADPRQLYVADDDGIVRALDILSGTVRWSQEGLKYRRLSHVVNHGPWVVVGDFEGYVHLLDREDGSLVGRVRVGRDAISSGISVVDAVLYVQGDGGEVAALRLPEQP